MTSRTRSLVAMALACLISLGAVAGAEAATRFAAPGATTVTASCTIQAQPCSIADAASNAQFGEEVVLAPGTYSDDDGDLGPSGSVQLKLGVSLRGAADQPRPVITLTSPAPLGA